MGVSDRVVVMHERRITGVLEGSELNQLAIAGLMTGRPANGVGGQAVAS
jgi:ribose transport system ATP-binding protein